ncbi:MAG TPA: MoaD/ThiS family protein [Candidatus Baltobacteraceae bacterium]|nr:MoaD/ThiS family protein [Candidatus Baltobacteraceae bacterium]
MRVHVLAFARMRELLGGASHDLEIEDGATAADVWDALANRYAAMAPLAGSTRIARNGRVLADSTERLEDGDELSLLPPAGGG